MTDEEGNVPIEIGVRSVGADDATMDDVTQYSANEERLEQQDNGDALLNDLTMGDIQDGIVSQKTNIHYVWDCIHFLQFIFDNEGGTDVLFQNILTDYGRNKVRGFRQHEGERTKRYRDRVFVAMDGLLRHAADESIVNIDAILPKAFMKYCLKICNKNRGLFE